MGRRFLIKTRNISRTAEWCWAVSLILSLLLWIGMAAAGINPALDEQLRKAAASGDVTLASTLLEKGADVNAKDQDGITALMEAAGEGHLQIVILLLEKGAEVNARSRTGVTPLIRAASGNHARVRSHHLRIVELLVQNGADVNARDNFGSTALHTASWVKNGAEVAKFLLDKGADVNAKDQRDVTPLLKAISGYHNSNESVELIGLLLNKGADVNVKSLGAKTPLLEAVAADHQIDVRHWYQVIWDTLKFQLWGKEWGPYYPLGGRSPETVKLLLEKGADIKASDQNGRTALQRAQNRGNIEIIDLLKANGAK